MSPLLALLLLAWVLSYVFVFYQQHQLDREIREQGEAIDALAAHIDGSGAAK